LTAFAQPRRFVPKTRYLHVNEQASARRSNVDEAVFSFSAASRTIRPLKKRLPRTTVKRLPPQIMPPRSYSISSGERDVMVTLTSLHCQTSCHGRNGGGFGGASPSSAHDMPAAKIMASTSASVFIVVLSWTDRVSKTDWS